MSCSQPPSALVPAKEDRTDLHPFRAATKSGARFGYIDHLGRIVIPPKFEGAYPFHEGLAAVKVSGRWGNIDASGNLAVPARYDEPLRFSEGLARVQLTRNKCNFFEFIGRNGKTVVPIHPGYWGGDFSGGLAYVQSVRKVGYIDRSGKLAIPLQPGWEDWTQFSDHLAPVKIHGNWGFINNRGRLVIPARFQPPITYKMGFGCFQGSEVHDPILFSESLAAVGFAGKAGFIDWNGRFAIEPRFDAALPFSYGLARVRVNGKWGYVDHAGRTVIPPAYAEAGPFREGLAAVQVKDLWGYIGKDGLFVIAPVFRGGGEFQAGLAEVLSTDGRWIYIDAKGVKLRDSPSAF